MNDAKTNKKPLFVFLQDISKAFDSMDPRMLRNILKEYKKRFVMCFSIAHDVFQECDRRVARTSRKSSVVISLHDFML